MVIHVLFFQSSPYIASFNKLIASVFLAQLPSGEEIDLPPIILGCLGSDPGKKTLCIYGHLDVQPARIDDGWDTDPFTMVEKDGESKTILVLVSGLCKITLSCLGM